MAACTDSKGEKHKARIRTNRFDSKKRSNCIKKEKKIRNDSCNFFSPIFLFFFFQLQKNCL